MNRTFPLLLLTFLACCFRSEGQQTNPGSGSKYQWFNFDWQGYTVAQQHFEKAAIFIPIRVNDLKGKLVAQFDLGSNETLLYGNMIRNYFGSRAALLDLVDTTTKVTNES